MIQYVLYILKDDQKTKTCLDNIEKWNCNLGDGKFDLIEYSSSYCKMDCKVLMDGYEVFRTWISNWIGLDVDNYITIQSLAYSCMLKRGCYQNVYQCSDVIQQVITKCVVGGRAMCNSNKQYHVKQNIADVDACSLCPSAVYFMDWLLKGLPKVLTDTSYEFMIKRKENKMDMLL